MTPKYLRDQRGVAMLLELLLVAVVLTLAGVAVYQANHHSNSPTAATTSQSPAPNSPAGIAAAASDTVLQESSSDATLSAAAESSTDELAQTDADVTSLGGTSNGSF
jgi:hypothetical protein